MRNSGQLGVLSNRSLPAAAVLSVLGVRKLAYALKLTPGAVSLWARPGYGDGIVPDRHKAAVCQLLTRHGAEYMVGAVMGAGSKRKGDRYEREIVNALLHVGISARRVPLSGAVAGYPGDVEIQLGGRWLLGQCKISSDGSGYRKIISSFDGANVIDIEDADDGLALIAVSFSAFLIAMRPHGNTHCFKVIYGKKKMSLQVARKALTGHHFLFFRKSRDESYVLMPRFVWDFTAKPRLAREFAA